MRELVKPFAEFDDSKQLVIARAFRQDLEKRQPALRIADETEWVRVFNLANVTISFEGGSMNIHKDDNYVSCMLLIRQYCVLSEKTEKPEVDHA